MGFEQRLEEKHRASQVARKNRLREEAIQRQLEKKKLEEAEAIKDAKSGYCPLIIRRLREDGKKLAGYLDIEKSDGKYRKQTVSPEPRRTSGLGNLILGIFTNPAPARSENVNIWILKAFPTETRWTTHKAQDTVLGTTGDHIGRGIAIDETGEYVKYEKRWTTHDDRYVVVGSQKAWPISDKELVGFDDFEIDGTGLVEEMSFVKNWQKELLKKV